VKLPELTVRNIRSVAVLVPMNYVLGTSAQAVREAPLLLVDVETKKGVTGHAYHSAICPPRRLRSRFCSTRCCARCVATGSQPAALWQKLAKRFTLIGVQGIVRMAMAMFDVACWDALAVAAKVPLVTLLGGSPARCRRTTATVSGSWRPPPWRTRP
jgi:mandelate racemase